MHYLPPPEFPRRSIPFRWIFPLGELFLCLFLLALMHFVPFLPWRTAMALTQGIALLNIPGTLLLVPEVFLRANRDMWAPPGVDPRTWAALSASVLGTPFWWMAGRAVDALQALKEKRCRPRMNWVETIVSFLIMSGGAVIFCAGVVYGFFIERDPTSLHLGAAGGLWALLGGLSVVARFRQWRLRKTLAVSAQSAASQGM
jgi:hypothetical protein